MSVHHSTSQYITVLTLSRQQPMDPFRNATPNATQHLPASCHYGPEHIAVLTIIDIMTILVGQPVIARLLWITLTSNKTPDVLNSNLAFFHNVQYLVSFVHLIVLYRLPRLQVQVVRFLLVFAQIGGPMSLSAICMQRYVAVVHPTSYHLLKKFRYNEVCAVMVWLLAVPSAFINATGFLSSYRGGILQNYPFVLLVFMATLVVRSSIPIWRMLKKSGVGNGKLHPAKERAVQAIRGTTFIAVSFYIPVAVMQSVFKDASTLDCLVRPVCVGLLSMASVVHPLFYLSTQGKLLACFRWETKPG